MLLDKKKVLIVDDEAHIVELVRVCLEDTNYEIIEAYDGQEALETVQRERPGLVSLDIKMPEMSGVKFYRKMREDETLREIPIVIVTGISNPWASPDGLGSFQQFLSSRKQIPPPDGFFEKPIDRDAYLETVTRLLPL